MEQKLKLEQIEQLLSLFDEREQLRLEVNRKIVYLLAPTVLSALLEALDASPDDIEWEDIRIVDTILLVVFTVTYDPVTTKSPILLKTTPQKQEGATPVQIQQMLHMSLPLAMAFDDKDTIKDFLLKVFGEAEAQPPKPELPPIDGPVGEFSPLTLTKEQVRQMLWFQQQTKGTKQ